MTISTPPPITAAQNWALPPHDLEAEQALLSAMLYSDAGELAEVRAMVDRRAFFHADNAIIFDSICRCADAGRTSDVVAVATDLARAGLLEEIGGQGYVAEVLVNQGTAISRIYYATMVREYHALRELIRIAAWLDGQARTPRVAADRPADIVAQAMSRIGDVLAAGTSANYATVGEVVAEAYDGIGRIEGGGAGLVPTGFPSLDALAGGIGIGEMLVLAARPSMGKSLLAKQIATKVARSGTPALYISLEDPRPKMGRNLLSAEAGVDNVAVRSGRLTTEEAGRLATAMVSFGQVPLYLTDRARRMNDIRAVVAQCVARHGVKFVVIDYIQRITGVPGKDRYERASETVTAVSDLFKEFGVAGIAVAQLNRGPEHRDDKRPTLSDLRDSGQIEQDADAVVFVHREDYYHLGDATYKPNQDVELIVAKWRDAIRGKVVKLKSNLRHQQFIDPHLSVEQALAIFGVPELSRVDQDAAATFDISEDLR